MPVRLRPARPRPRARALRARARPRVPLDAPAGGRRRARSAASSSASRRTGASAGRGPTPCSSLYGAWSALYGQALFNPPETWYLEVLHGVYPLVGFVLLGEGVVRFALLMTSRRRGEREWMKVMASTLRDHVVLCGTRAPGLAHPRAARGRGRPTSSSSSATRASRFALAAKERGTAILDGDMRDDRVLEEAGIAHARCIVAATNDDMANLEVALDARRMNPKIRVLIRFFDRASAPRSRTRSTSTRRSPPPRSRRRSSPARRSSARPTRRGADRVPPRPLVSVCVPTFRGGPWIDATLATALAQTSPISRSSSSTTRATTTPWPARAPSPIRACASSPAAATSASRPTGTARHRSRAGTSSSSCSRTTFSTRVASSGCSRPRSRATTSTSCSRRGT